MFRWYCIDQLLNTTSTHTRMAMVVVLLLVGTLGMVLFRNSHTRASCAGGAGTAGQRPSLSKGTFLTTRKQHNDINKSSHAFGLSRACLVLANRCLNL